VARTGTEELLHELRRSSRSTDLLVPLVEKFMKNMPDVEDDEDREFMNNLILARSQPRKKGVYSPSMLSSCVRQVYLTKTGEQKRDVGRISSNGYFVEGNFRHFKWQFIVWKMHRAGIVQLVDVGSICIGTEIYVHNNRGDYGGTIDNLIYIPGPDVIVTVDWKGMNSNNFYKAIAANYPQHKYAVQVAGYAGLANASLDLSQKIEHAVVIYENKNGAVQTRLLKSPLGLKEYRVDIKKHRSEITSRLKTLRAAERRDEIPPVECVSTRRVMFKDCPFAPICRGEVEQLERKERKKKKIRKKPTVQFIKKR